MLRTGFARALRAHPAGDTACMLNFRAKLL